MHARDAVQHSTLFLRRALASISKRYRDLLRPVAVIGGIRLHVDRAFPEYLKEALREGLYEHEELELVEFHLRPNDVVMEIGAGLGLISAYCARRIGSERVHAFEANRTQERRIRRAYQLNGVAPTLEMALIGESGGHRQFFVYDGIWGSYVPWPQGRPEMMSVPVRAFNEEVRRVRPTFLIIDVDGAEADMCRYADFHTVQTIVIEVHEHLIGSEGVQFVRSQLGRACFRMAKQSPSGYVWCLQRDVRVSPAEK